MINGSVQEADCIHSRLPAIEGNTSEQPKEQGTVKSSCFVFVVRTYYAASMINQQLTYEPLCIWVWLLRKRTPTI